jgi:hypothetical protein
MPMFGWNRYVLESSQKCLSHHFPDKIVSDLFDCVQNCSMKKKKPANAICVL